MQLFIRGFDDLLAVEVNENDTVQQIKNHISERKGVDCGDIVLNCSGVMLNNEVLVNTLTSFELDVTVPLIGGKVHGSLARAGKVKGQTPKVDKQAKKKKKTGRAKRRIQYNRRFINSVQGFGRRRGPNANSA